MYAEAAADSTRPASALGQDEVADPKPRRDRLREGRAVDDVLPPASSNTVGSVLPSKRTSPYGSSSRTSKPPFASFASRLRRSSGNVRPVGFWKVGIV